MSTDVNYSSLTWQTFEFGYLSFLKSERMLYDYPTALRGFYCVYDFNLLLLFIIPANSLIITRRCVTFICIIIVLFGDLCTTFMRCYGVPDGVPAVPFPAVLITAYAIIPDAIGQYLDTDCESLSRMKDNFLYSF